MIKVTRYHNGKTIPYRLPDLLFGDKRDIQLDLTGALHNATIDTADWTIYPPDAQISTATNTNTTTTATITAPASREIPDLYWARGRGYRIDVHVTASDGQKINTPLVVYIATGFE